jgi:hypothetical protein
VNKLPPDKIVEEAYLTALSRKPTEDETTRLSSVITSSGSDDPRPVLEDMYWAILSSKEFLFNH